MRAKISSLPGGKLKRITTYNEFYNNKIALDKIQDKAYIKHMFAVGGLNFR